MKILEVARQETDTVKTVDYFGEQFTILGWIKYLAMDKSGELYGYESKPFVYDDEMQFMSDGYLVEDPEHIATIVYDGDWKDSLIEV